MVFSLGVCLLQSCGLELCPRLPCTSSYIFSSSEVKDGKRIPFEEEGTRIEIAVFSVILRQSIEIFVGGFYIIFALSYTAFMYRTLIS
jgi:hypothetical protein